MDLPPWLATHHVHQLPRVASLPTTGHSLMPLRCLGDDPNARSSTWPLVARSALMALAAARWYCVARDRCTGILRRAQKQTSMPVRTNVPNSLPYYLAKDMKSNSSQTLPVARMRKSPGEIQHASMKRRQINSLNSVLQKIHKRNRRRGIAPTITYRGRPDNPWTDRYMLCQDCEREEKTWGKSPRKECNNSTFIELDMTLPFTRDNCMVTSCEIAQIIRDDVWVFKDKYGTLSRSKEKNVPAFPVQVCCQCRSLSTEEGRRFLSCSVCDGVSYCSEKCLAEHQLKHKETCMKPHLPYRQEWGVRPQLRKLRKEIYPLINMWAIREPEKHRIAWLPPPEHQQKLLRESQTPKKISLPGLGRGRKLLAAEGTKETMVDAGGKIVLVEKQELGFRRPRGVHAKKQVDPDPAFLLAINMTKEEYLKRDAELRELAELEDDAAAADAALFEEPEPQFQVMAGRGVALSEEAMSRFESAVEDVDIIDIDQRQASPTRPPWESAAERRKLKGISWKPVPLEKKKEGVVYPDSPVRELAKKYNLQLSDETLDALEDAAEKTKVNHHRMSWQTPRLREDAEEMKS
eukprot:gb/GFBE01017850.1/.p1 GENE.gb/GFBE01017850.1/~~gb/GFBE01017850.1/.p1  ORF type:complete len:577 (+),score=107.31 gb/GFBE01017850.1/:1-1731(+)